MCECLYFYIHIYIYIYVCDYLRVCVRVRLCVRVRVCVCLCVCLRVRYQYFDKTRWKHRDSSRQKTSLTLYQCNVIYKLKN